MLEIILEPLQYAFMQWSLIVAITVGIICAVVGSYLMVQRLALLGDAISHSVLPGLAIAYIVGANIFVGAFIAGVISTIFINFSPSQGILTNPSINWGGSVLIRELTGLINNKKT